MEIDVASFRHGLELISHLPEWAELQSVMRGITETDIIEIQTQELESRPVGAQRALNVLFNNRLTGVLGWEGQVLVFPNAGYARALGAPAPDPPFPERKIDFMKNHLGVEVAFNNESYLERILFRLNVASESEFVIPESEVVAGVIEVASERLKRWGSMDTTVATFEGSQRSLSLVRNAFSIPLLLVGLFPDEGWEPISPAFGRRSAGAAVPVQVGEDEGDPAATAD